jgi:hypothetical protein
MIISDLTKNIVKKSQSSFGIILEEAKKRTSPQIHPQHINIKSNFLLNKPKTLQSDLFNLPNNFTNITTFEQHSLIKNIVIKLNQASKKPSINKMLDFLENNYLPLLKHLSPYR